MGRKSKSGKKSAKDESDEGEVQEDLESEVAVDRSDAFDMSEAIEMLSEKKYNLREPALKKIISFMQGSHDGEESLQVLDGFTETLTTHLTRMLRRPASDQEGILCLQLVCLLALYLSGDAVSLLKSIEKPIMALIQAKEATPLQSQALFTWSFTSFVSEKEEIVHEALETIESILLNECGDEFGDELLTRAAEGWVLLCTLLPAATVLSKSKDESLFEALFTQIDEASSTSINSKVAAGKVLIAVLSDALTCMTPYACNIGNRIHL